MINKYRISIILSVLILLPFTNVSAQKKNKKQGYILLHKNGSEVKGIIEYKGADTIRMRTKCNNIFVFERKDIRDIRLYDVKVKPYKKIKIDSISKGFYNYNTIGLLTGNSEVLDDFTFSFQTNFGYEFYHWLGVGLGVGVEKLRTEILPMSLSAKSHIFNSATSPFVSINLGYSIPLSKTKKIDDYSPNSKYEGGFHYGVDIGMETFRSKSYALTITVGYKYQSITEITDFGNHHIGYNYKETTSYNFHKIAVRIGFMFKLHKSYKSYFY